MTVPIPSQPSGFTPQSLATSPAKPVSKPTTRVAPPTVINSERSLPPDQWQNQPLKARRFGDQQIRLLNNVLELVNNGETLLKAGDQNGDQRLSRAELTTYRPPLDQSAEERFGQKALQGKLIHHFDAIDLQKDGLDSDDLNRLRAQALGQSAWIQTIAAVPVKELHLQESIRDMPASKPYTLVPKEIRSHSFESRFQPYGATASADLKHLETSVQMHQWELPGTHQFLIIQPAELRENAHLPMPQLVAEAASALPVVLQKQIHIVELNPLPYTFEIEGKANPDSADMTASPGGKIAIYPRAQPTSISGIYRTLIHESAHLLGFEKLGAEGTEKAWIAWKEAMAKDEVAPSAYARLNGSQPGIEDFAESVTVWVLSQGQSEHEEWRALMPARFAFLDLLLTDTPLEF